MDMWDVYLAGMAVGVILTLTFMGGMWWFICDLNKAEEEQDRLHAMQEEELMAHFASEEHNAG